MTGAQSLALTTGSGLLPYAILGYPAGAAEPGAGTAETARILDDLVAETSAALDGAPVYAELAAGGAVGRQHLTPAVAGDPDLARLSAWRDLLGHEALSALVARTLPVPSGGVLVVLPVCSEETRLGALVALLPEEPVASSREMAVLRGATRQAALAAERAYWLDVAGRASRSSLDALVSTLEARDRYTYVHSRSAADFALLIGRTLGWEARRLEHLCRAALLHDIGKIGIPDHILQKPGSLTPEEEVVVMSHSDIGASILGAMPGLDDFQAMVRHHHERFDGSGYPAGLAGETIPIEARLLAVADAFDAMTSDRPYRAGMAVDEAVQRLEQAAGVQFDPTIVAAFVPALQEEIRSRSALGERLRQRAASARERTARGHGPATYYPIARPDAASARGGRILMSVLRQTDALWDVDYLLSRISLALMQELPACDIRGWLGVQGRRLVNQTASREALKNVPRGRLPGRAWLPLYANGQAVAYLEVAGRSADAIGQEEWSMLLQLAPQLGKLLASTLARCSS